MKNIWWDKEKIKKESGREYNKDNMYYSIPKTHFRLEVKHFQHLSWLVIMCKANESLQSYEKSWSWKCMSKWTQWRLHGKSVTEGASSKNIDFVSEKN